MAPSDAMTRAEIDGFVRRHLASFARRDPGAVAADHAPEGIVESPMFATLRGRPAIEESYRSLFRTFPDWSMTPAVILIDPPRAALFVKIAATQMNEFFGLPGTQRRVEFECVLRMTFENGLIAEEQRIYDFTGFLVQVGVLRAKPAKP
jgi:predicted ester cyclase